MEMSLQICPICKLPSFRRFRLCRHCAAGLRPLAGMIAREGTSPLTRSLFSWSFDGPQALTDLVYGLKGADQPGPWAEFAIWMINLFPILPEDTLLVPVPGTGPNHALGFARALGEFLNLPVEDALCAPFKGGQKARNKLERGEIQFRLKGVNPCREYSTVVIVDDVITTGATARAAFEGLGQPSSCEVWCLMDRQSCDGGGPLL